MKSHDGSHAPVHAVHRFVRSTTLMALALAGLLVGLSATVALAVPAPPVISGPTAIQFAYHPAGFRATIAWDPVPTAVKYQIYDADTLFYAGSVTSTSAMVYGMQNVLYHHYVVAVDSSGATSTPSNIVDIQTSAPVAPAVPLGVEVLPSSVFTLQTSTAPAGALPIKLPYNPLLVTGDPTDLKLLEYADGTWADVTTSVDTTRNFVLGTALPASVYAVVQSTGIVYATLTPSAGPNGSISPATPLTVAYGDSATFTISPDAGYHVADVVVDGISVGPVNSYAFASVAGDHSVYASFVPNPVTIATHTTFAVPRAVRIRRPIVLVGSVTPATAPGTVVISMSRLVRGRWVNAGAATVAVTDGTFHYTFAPTRRGAWRIMATYTGDVTGSVTHEASTSGLKRLTVK